MMHCEVHSFSNMAEARIRNEDWVEDEQLVADIRKYVMQNMKREEALDFSPSGLPTICMESTDFKQENAPLWHKIRQL